MKIFHSIVLASTIVITSVGANANDDKSGFALGFGVGTTGVSGSATYKLSDHFNVRGVYAQYDFSEQDTSSGIDYNFDIELNSFSLLLDYHPFATSGFRLSAGAVKNGTEFNATSTQTTGNISVGNGSFTAAQVGTLNANVSYDSFAPYVGIGWGNAVSKNRNLSFAVDIGVIGMDDPTVTLTSSGGNAAVNAELENERRELEASLDDFALYPVVNLSLNYQF
jgi:hypothetical protein